MTISIAIYYCNSNNVVVGLVLMETLNTLLDIALDLTAAWNTADRYERLLLALGRVIPYDLAAVHRKDGEGLVPVAARGLSLQEMNQRYELREHPRLSIICKAFEPVRFSASDPNPDPFDFLLVDRTGRRGRIHACLGCPLRWEGQLIGALTADALDPKAFDDLDQEFLRVVGALAGAQMQTAQLLEALERNAENQSLVARHLVGDIEMQQGKELLGRSPVIQRIWQEIRMVADSDLTVLVMGETGVGKELVVRGIHEASSRCNAPLLYLNCAALPETLAESELFGHTKGAFTGAQQERTGKFELARGGTLFLDEIGELSLSTQPKLLRAIESKEVQRLGSDTTIHVDVRLIAATNRNLKEEVRAGRFRADLFHRLNVYPITVPPLRERIEDIPLLASHFADRIRRRMRLGPVSLSPDALAALCKYEWPGNVRELENVVSRAVFKASSGLPRGKAVLVKSIHLDYDLGNPGALQPPLLGRTPAGNHGSTLRHAMDEFQKELIRGALERSGGNWAAAARELGMHRSNLHNLAVRLGLRKSKHKREF